MALYAIIVFVVGLAIGSFLDVLIYRIDDLKSVLSTRSHCVHCKYQLAWYDLIPLLSFVFLLGKCRECKQKISLQYPAVELGTAILLLLLFVIYGISWPLAFYSVIFSILIVVFVYDIQKQLIAEELVWTALVISIFSWYFGHFSILSMVLGGLICGGVPALLVVVSREKWMGSGDIKLGLLVGFLVGYPRAMFLIFLAFVLGAIIGLVYMAVKKKGLKDSLPFAPFLISAALITLVIGEPVVRWYLGYFMIVS
jgi:leader peptidase (prepilin peptidase)/N-methyltransferase